MNIIELENKLTGLLSTAVSLPKKYSELPQPYNLRRDDVSFARSEINKNVMDVDSRVDSFIKLYIAFYIDTIPSQVVDSLKGKPQLYKTTETAKEYLVEIAGMLFEAKNVLIHNNEMVLPYLIAYKDYLGDEDLNEVADEDLISFFLDEIEQSIQVLINY